MPAATVQGDASAEMRARAHLHRALLIQALSYEPSIRDK
jgi:hypothetical protein